MRCVTLILPVFNIEQTYGIVEVLRGIGGRGESSPSERRGSDAGRTKPTMTEDLLANKMQMAKDDDAAGAKYALIPCFTRLEGKG